jgi:hypothetical protein
MEGCVMNIKELAKKSGLTESNNDGIRIETGYWVEELTRFAALVAAHEREECAKMVDHILKAGGGTYGDAIRARGKL